MIATALSVAACGGAEVGGEEPPLSTTTTLPPVTTTLPPVTTTLAPVTTTTLAPVTTTTLPPVTTTLVPVTTTTLPPVTTTLAPVTTTTLPPVTTTSETITTTTRGSTTHTVSMGDNFFAPTNIVISVGDKVRWRNDGVELHTSTSGTRPIADGTWDSYLPPGESFTRTFDSAGTFSYFCVIHVGQSGTVTVNP